MSARPWSRRPSPPWPPRAACGWPWSSRCRPASRPVPPATWTRCAGCPGSRTCTSWPVSLIRYLPEAAARQAARPPLDLSAAAVYVKQVDADLVLVEGAGGLLVRYDPAGTTIADLAAMLGAPVLVVTQPGLGTLNHTALSLEAMKTRRLALAGVVIGAWPAHPDLAERVNLTDLEIAAGQPLAGALAAGAGTLDRQAFLAVARAGLGRRWAATGRPLGGHRAATGRFSGALLSALSVSDNSGEQSPDLISPGHCRTAVTGAT